MFSGELTQRAANGDAVALKLLLTTSHEHLCHRIAHRIPRDLRPLIAPEDLAQETHVEVFRRIRSFEHRGPDAFERWIMMIGMTRLRNAIRHHRTAKRGGKHRIWRASAFEDSTVSLFDALAGPGTTPSRSFARREVIDAVQTALSALPEHYRQAIQLVHIEGVPIRAAALEMGRTERALHGLCRRGLSLMRSQLQSAGRFLSSSG